MPTLLGLKVVAADTYNAGMTEWGIKKFKKARMASCYIEAKTGRQFKIIIEPSIPFIDPDRVASHHYGTRNQPDPHNNPGYFTIGNKDDVYDNDDNQGTLTRSKITSLCPTFFV
jgi:hypothetical protein